jgi:uncharacterized protein
MSVYLDASVIIPLFADDLFTARASAFLAELAEPVVVSDFAAAEVASGVSKLVRMGSLPAKDGHACLADFDHWRLAEAAVCQTTSADIHRAGSYLRRLDLPLRTPDALNLALAERLATPVATFDRDMAACARILGLRLIEI